MNIELLPPGVMGFCTKDGQTFFIGKDDIEKITIDIIAKGSVKKQVVILQAKDITLDKADFLYKVLKENPEMDNEMKAWYFQTIADLLSGEDVELTNIFTKEKVKLVDD
jgi:hypothetical protein